MLHLERFETAAALYDRVLPLARENGFPAPDLRILLYNSACALAMTGRGDEALERLREAVDLGYDEDGIFDDPALEPLRGRTEFEAMVKEVRQRDSDRDV